MTEPTTDLEIHPRGRWKLTKPSALLSAVFTRELPTETIEVDGRQERHVTGCSCTTKLMRWPCQDVTP